MSIVDNDRPPYVVWEIRQVEDRAASIAKGHYSTKDVDFAIITRPGSRDTMDREALPWLADLKQKANKGELPLTWYQGFQSSYDAWRKGEELPTEGTPIKGWPLLSPAAQKDLVHIGIRTVEDLAAFSDSELGQIGLGALAMKLKAQEWLKAANGPGKAAEEAAAIRTQLAQLIELTRQQAETIKTLQDQIPVKQKA